jgi:chromosomal replication initiation ATPase DnaA
LRHARTNALSWKEITQAVANAWGTEWELAKEAHRSGVLAAALYVSRHYSDHSLREFGQLVGGMQYPAVTMAIRRFEKRLPLDKRLVKRLNRVLKMLQVKT